VERHALLRLAQHQRQRRLRLLRRRLRRHAGQDQHAGQLAVDVTDTVVGVGNAATWSFAVPNSGALSGFKLYNQAAVLDTSNAFGFVTSKAYAWIVGS
jgi:hypothetical protein